MPKVKTNRVKFPEGWELIEPTLRDLQAKMREGWYFFLHFFFWFHFPPNYILFKRGLICLMPFQFLYLILFCFLSIIVDEQ